MHLPAWDKFLDKQEKELGSEIVDKWLRSLKVVHFDAANLYLQANDSFQISWFEEHMRPKISTLLNNNYRPIKVHLSVEPPTLSKERAAKKSSISSPPYQLEPDSLDPNMRFDNFIPGQVNQITYNFFQTLSSATFNPILLYGPAGVGKTHLLMALANHLKEQAIAVFYIHSESFTEHVVNAIRTFQMKEFRKIYRAQSVLIIDDIQLLARKAATQEEFFHTFNALHSQNHLIVLSADRPPSKLEDIEPRLISRFEWGIIFQLEKLSKTELELVLEKRGTQLQFPLNHEIINFLVETFSKSTKSLMRAYEALILRSSKTAPPQNITQTIELISDLIAIENESKLTLEKISEQISNYFGIPVNDILGKSQSHECVLPRQVIMFLSRNILKLPYLAIGKFFSRDHSTVISSIKLIQKKIDEKDSTILEAIESFSKENP